MAMHPTDHVAAPRRHRCLGKRRRKIMIPVRRFSCDTSMRYYTGFRCFFRSIHTRREPVRLPETTTLSILDFPPQPRPTRPLSSLMRKAKTLVFNGPKGEVVVPLHYFVNMSWGAVPDSKIRTITFSVEDENARVQRSIWGLTRALCANAIKGVEEGHVVTLRLVGVGYRASVEPDPLPRKHPFEVELERSRGHWYAPEQKQTEMDRIKRLIESSGANERLHMRLGFSHPVLVPIPYGIKAVCETPTLIKLQSVDKQLLGQFAQSVRQIRKPEPYKGKGVFLNDEQIKLKTPKKK